MLINYASQDERVDNHPGLKLYGIESYIAVPLYRRDRSYFGTLCALDPLPAKLSENNFAIFELLADLVSFELEAEDKKQEQEAQIGALNDFISIAAHDLRQPLSTMLLRAQLTARRAKREGISAELIAGIDGVVADIRRTMLLTDTLLDVGRLQAGTFAISLSEVDLAALVRQILEDVKTNSPNHSFQLQSPENLQVKGDGVKLTQVVRNLLDNAVKYSPGSQEPIEVTVSSKAGAALVQVRDHGRGVSEDDLPRLFERQYRTQQAIDTGIGGSGLGLYISQKIVEEHGGQLWAEIAPGGGLRVSFSL